MPIYSNHFRAWVCLSFILFITLTGCTKFVQVEPPSTKIASSTVYDNNTSAAAVMTGVYSNMNSNGSANLSSGQASISYLMGLAADELINYSPGKSINVQFYSNTLSSSFNGKSNYYFWTELYKEIYVCNAIIAGIENPKSLSASLKNQIMGEAKFMRAFLHFYAVNLYGDVPLLTTTDYRVNDIIHRSQTAQVYQQIISDLKDARAKLSDAFLDASGNVSPERVRPNKAAASALLARAYLYTGDWADAESVASAVIGNTQYALDENLDDVFLKNSTETIWQLKAIANTGYNTFDGYFFVLPSAPGTGRFSVSLNPLLVNTFETGDARFAQWVGTYMDNTTTYYYPYKYKIGFNDPTVDVTEYTTVLRLAEQYLIRAEAKTQQGKIQDAQTDLDMIRARAGLPNTTANDKVSLLNAIYHERQVELFTEWGHRWFDLKRTGTIDAVMSDVTPQKGGSWQPNWALLPLPLAETKINPNLTQNPGYN